MRLNTQVLMTGLSLSILMAACGSSQSGPAPVTEVPAVPEVPVAQEPEPTTPIEPTAPIAPTIGTTVALLHFDGDSENASFLNVDYAEGIFGGAVQFTGEKQSAVLLDPQPEYATLNSQMTLEGWLKISELPTERNAKIPFMSRGSLEATDWEFGISLIGIRTKFYFTGRIGADTITVYSAPLTSKQLADGLLQFQHTAVTWDKGAVQFWFNGQAFGSATLGILGEAMLEDSQTGISLGRNARGDAFSGSMDEVRISQAIRWSADFELATESYDLD